MCSLEHFLSCIDPGNVAIIIFIKPITIFIRIIVLQGLELLLDCRTEFIQLCCPKLIEKGNKLQPIHQYMVFVT